MCQAVTPRFMDQYLIDVWSGLQLNTLKKTTPSDSFIDIVTEMKTDD